MTWRRSVLAGALGGLVLVVAGQPLGAAAAELGGRNNPDAEGTSFTLFGTGADIDRVTISLSPGKVVFRNSSSPITLSAEDTNELPPCIRPTPNQVRCNALGPGDNVLVDLGAGNDSLTVLGGRVRGDGGGGNDVIIGAVRGEAFTGGAGNDTLKGRGGSDSLNGGVGNDLLSGSVGNDRLIGGPGLDQFAGFTGNDSIDAADGTAETVVCGLGVDSVKADSSDRLSGCERVTRG